MQSLNVLVLRPFSTISGSSTRSLRIQQAPGLLGLRIHADPNRQKHWITKRQFSITGNTVFRILDILVDLVDANKIFILNNSFCSLLFEGTFTSFFKDKKHKEVTKQ
jgi:hypothetical protein